MTFTADQRRARTRSVRTGATSPSDTGTSGTTASASTWTGTSGFPISTVPPGFTRTPRGRSSSSEEFRARSQATMRQAVVRTDGEWAEGVVREIDDLVRVIGWTRPRDAGKVLQALTGAGRISARDWVGVDVDFEKVGREVLTLANRVSTVAHPLREVVAAHAAEAVETVRAVSFARELGGADGNSTLTDWSLRTYGAPSREIVDHARDLLTAGWAEPWPQQILPATRAAWIVEQTLAVLAPGWAVRIEPIVASMTVDGAKLAVVVSADHWFTVSEIARLLVHEIGSHVLRRVNATASPGSLAQVSFGTDATSTEEGLAVWWEQTLGVGTSSTMRGYAARVVAVDVALRGSIFDVVAALAPYIPTEDAARIAIRVKRGMSDPTLPGALTKDHVYLSGFVAVSDYLRQFPDRIDDLMSTKWGLSMQTRLAVVRQEGLLTGLPRLPNRQTLLAALPAAGYWD